MSSDGFPETRVSAVVALFSDDSAARAASLDRLVRVYYRPVYIHLRCKWRKSPTEAEDYAQEFFTHAVERGLFKLYEVERGRFRAFVRVCLDRFTLTIIQGENRIKRGGGIKLVSADVGDVEASVAAVASSSNVEDVFDREWVRSVFARSVAALKEKLVSTHREKTFEAFARYDLDDGPDRPSYADIAAALGVGTGDITNYLHAARKELRKLVLETLREVTASEEEFEAEAREVLGVNVSALHG